MKSSQRWLLTAALLASTTAWGLMNAPSADAQAGKAVTAQVQEAAGTPSSAAPAEKTTKTEATTDKIVWHSYTEGLAKAKKEKKPIIIDFTASWCGWCKRMDRDTFSDKEVIRYMNENVVSIKVWGDANTPVSHEGEKMTEKALARVFGVRGYPTFWFLDAEGGRIGPTSGYKKPDQFLPLIEYVAENHYKTMSYDNYLKKRAG